ncbi:hypothetical protein PV682_35680 [Streptomyces niveiscabiei]|uniref:hypothetical protein n=1 Tax=Streptomyces niveiscabiei TaxID=164115 RepID=UPI0029A69580|nr:hypothetical protein [Streptomyces niveiscabiei]MDX3386745.1 hypothetical protein [Streptomyces niveiscabiei]
MKLKFATAAATGLAVVGTLLTGAQSASAADWYDQSALLTSCEQDVDGLGKADRCRFEPHKRTVFAGPAKQIGSTVHACGTPVTMGRQTSESRTEENSVSVSAGVEAGLSKIFSASIQTSYGHSWSYSMTETEEVSAEVPKFSIGTVTLAPAMQRVSGKMIINYPKRRHGHFEWYAYPTLTQYNPDQMEYSTVSIHTRPMNASERSSMCPSHPTETEEPAPSAKTTTLRVAKGDHTQGADLSATPEHADD